MNLGFIGLGTMGAPMAKHLLNAGHTVHGFTPRKSAQVLKSMGLQPCANLVEVASRSQVVFLMVPNTPEVEDTLFSPQGLAAGLKPGSIVVDMSTISPVATRSIANRIEQLSCSFLDAPVSGGNIGAIDGTLTIMVGGSQSAFEQVRPLFACMGKVITHIGANGHGQLCKAANQIMVSLHLAAAAEALAFVTKAGADAVKVREALMGGFASSRVLEVHGKRMLESDFAPRFRVSLHQKDLQLVLAAARDAGVSLPHTAVMHSLMNSLEAQGGGDLDNSAFYKVLWQLSGQ